MRWFHPSRRRLQQWLETGEPVDVDAHVATCRRCAGVLEDLATPLPELNRELTARLTPPDDLVQRLGTRLERSMQNRQDLALLVEMLGVPWRTVRTILDEEPE